MSEKYPDVPNPVGPLGTKQKKGGPSLNDKIPVIVAILVLAGLATIHPHEQGLLHFFSMLASGLFGLVTGLAIGRSKNTTPD